MTPRVPNFLVSLSDNKLDTIVPPEITIDTMPIYDIGAFSSPYIAGHPDPSSESGNPKLMNAK